MVKNIRIEKKIIGDNQPTFIIAEAGVNHNGKLELAKNLVDIAVQAGADAVKFQTFKSEGVTTSTVDSADYVKKNLNENVKQLEILKKLELSYSDFKKLRNYCDKKNIIFLSTPHSYDAIDFLEKLVPAYKFGSGDITNIPAIKYAAMKKKPIILGTGMSNISEIKRAIKAIKSTGNNQIIALHCTTDYPTSLEDVNLKAMLTMKKELNCLIGYSDHTIGTTVAIAAVALGANVIEKHFTIDKKMKGPDHRASANPEELKEMISRIRETEKILGNSIKKPTKSEKKNMNIIRKSIVAKKDIRKGVKITRDMIIIKRPGTGLEPSKIEEILGKKTRKYIKKDEFFTKKMVE